MHRLLCTLLLAIVAAVPAHAQTKPSTATSGSEVSRPERGWFFFDDPVVPKEEPKSEFKSQIPSAPPPPPKEERCKKKESWSVDCGFVNPGEDFQFQSKQRDALMERMSVAKNDLKAVEAFQYYMRYVIDRTSEVTNNWWYNMVQNPNLDPNVSNPVSSFGIRLMTEVKQGRDKEVFDLIRAEGGFLVYFTRSDCMFCHQMSPTVQMLSKKTGLEVRNAALDDKCMPEFLTGCVKAPASTGPAQMLQVATVPTVFLHVPPNTWLRIATGVVDLESTVARTSQFFAAYRAALVSGVENGGNGRPSVDFTGAEPDGSSRGVSGASAEGGITPPTQDEVLKMLGASGR
jgi:hypothetical protein